LLALIDPAKPNAGLAACGNHAEFARAAANIEYTPTLAFVKDARDGHRDRDRSQVLARTGANVGRKLAIE